MLQITFGGVYTNELILKNEYLTYLFLYFLITYQGLNENLFHKQIYKCMCISQEEGDEVYEMLQCYADKNVNYHLTVLIFAFYLFVYQLFEYTHVSTNCARVGTKFSSARFCGCLLFRRAQGMPVGLFGPQQKLVGHLIKGPSKSTQPLNERAGFLTHDFLSWDTNGRALLLHSLRTDVALSGVFDSA